MDEPTAGMDPVARRSMWGALQAVGSGRSVILTTHHLEEVEALANRVAIMVAGEMQCIASLNRLKEKYGGGYEVEAKIATLAAVPNYITQITARFQNSTVLEKTGERVTIRLAKGGDDKLSDIFSVMESNRKEYQIVDYSINQTSLEQVFMSICKKWEDDKDAEEAEAIIRNPKARIPVRSRSIRMAPVHLPQISEVEVVSEVEAPIMDTWNTNTSSEKFLTV